MKNYRLYDLCEVYGIVLNKNTRIGEYETLEECERAAIEHERDCDGECEIWICKRNPQTGTFLAIDAEHFDYYAEV